jgi:hypothetical protein
MVRPYNGTEILYCHSPTGRLPLAGRQRHSLYHSKMS